MASTTRLVVPSHNIRLSPSSILLRMRWIRQMKISLRVSQTVDWKGYILVVMVPIMTTRHTRNVTMSLSSWQKHGRSSLSNKNLDTGGARLLVNGYCIQTLKYIGEPDISNNKIGTLMPPDGWTEIDRSYLKMHFTKMVRKSNCEGQLQPAGIIALVNAIESTGNISGFSNNEIERQGLSV